MTLADQDSGLGLPFGDEVLLVRERCLTWRRLGLSLVVAGPGPKDSRIVGEPGVLVWDLLGRRRMFVDLVEDVVAITEGDPGDVQAGVSTLLAMWRDLGWVIAVDG